MSYGIQSPSINDIINTNTNNTSINEVSQNKKLLIKENEEIQ